MTIVWRFAAALLAIMMFAVAGCSSISRQTEDTFNGVNNRVASVERIVVEAKPAYDEKIKDPKFDFYRAYSSDDRHEFNFVESQAKLAVAKAVQVKLKQIVDDWSNRSGEFDGVVAEANILLGDAEALVTEPSRWADIVYDVKQMPGQFLDEMQSAAGRTNDYVVPLESASKKSIEKFPAQLDEINRRLSVFMSRAEASNTATQSAKDEAELSIPNYAMIATSHKLVMDNYQATMREVSAYREALRGLPDVETHTLIDIKVDADVYVTRTSWDENSDFDTDKDYEYALVRVDAPTADYFASLAPGTVLASSYFNNGNAPQVASGIDLAQWQKLGIDGNKDWPQGSNSGEWYFDELDETYCHKLKVMKNGEFTSVDRPDPTVDPCSQYNTNAEIAEGIYWQESDELEAENIGMDIYSKARGEFADMAASSGATPPGMVLVDDADYGQWVEDEPHSSGGSVWVFYNRYGFYPSVIGGPNPTYSRSEYGSWKSTRYSGKPFYGNVNGQPRFGGKSPQTQSRFPGSYYVRTGVHDATVRGAGVSARAGGPGGGGK